MIVSITNISQNVISGPLGLMQPGQTLTDNLFMPRRLELIGKDLAALAAQTPPLVRYAVYDDPAIPDSNEIATRYDVSSRNFDTGIIVGTGAAQFIPHPLGRTPTQVEVVLYDPSTTVTFLEGWGVATTSPNTATGSGLLTSGTGASATATLAIQGSAGTVFKVTVAAPTSAAASTAGAPGSVTVSYTWATSDNASATALAAAIIAAAPYMLASATAGTNIVTMTALYGGIPGNNITVTASASGGSGNNLIALNGGTAAASVGGTFGTGTATAGTDTAQATGTLTIATTIFPPPTAQIGFNLGAYTVSVPWQGSANATATALAAAATAITAPYPSSGTIFLSLGNYFTFTASTNTVVVTAKAGGAYNNSLPFSVYGSHDANYLVFNTTSGKRFRAVVFG